MLLLDISYGCGQSEWSLGLLTFLMIIENKLSCPIREKLVAEAEEQRRREEIAQRPRLPSLHNSNPTFLDNSQRDLQPHFPPPPFATARGQVQEQLREFLYVYNQSRISATHPLKPSPVANFLTSSQYNLCCHVSRRKTHLHPMRKL